MRRPEVILHFSLPRVFLGEETMSNLANIFDSSNSSDFHGRERLIEPSQKWLGKSGTRDALAWSHPSFLPVGVDRFLFNYIPSKAIMQTPFTEIARLNCAWNGTSARKVICPFPSILSLINFIAQFRSASFFSPPPSQPTDGFFSAFRAKISKLKEMKNIRCATIRFSRRRSAAIDKQTPKILDNHGKVMENFSTSGPCRRICLLCHCNYVI